MTAVPGLPRISTGTAYAVWVGVGASPTVAMITGDEQFSIVKMLLILGLVGCVAGLKRVGEH